MSVMKEWECRLHGAFESTHPLCPEIGCDSEDVKRVFLTPPTISDGMLKRFDRGIKRSVDMYGLKNLRSARGGEAAYGNEGKGMLWGNDVQKVLGVDMGALLQASATPLQVTHADGRKETVEKSVMREMGQAGITRQVLPKPAELTGHVQDRVKR